MNKSYVNINGYRVFVADPESKPCITFSLDRFKTIFPHLQYSDLYQPLSLQDVRADLAQYPKRTFEQVMQTVSQMQHDSLPLKKLTKLLGSRFKVPLPLVNRWFAGTGRPHPETCDQVVTFLLNKLK